jgi:hypothetical protein
MADEPGQKPISRDPPIERIQIKPRSADANVILESYTDGDQEAGEEKLAISESAPIVQIARGVGLDVDKGGTFVRLKVETLTQGDVVLHVEMPMVNELISMLSAGRFHAERFAAAIGKSVTRAILPVQSFATGDLPQIPQGVMLILNHGTPAESVYILPNAQAARDIAKSLAREADQADLRSRGVIAPGACKGVLLGPGGIPINPNGRAQ